LIVPQITRSAYVETKQCGIVRLPRTLAEAIEKLSESKIAREILGKDFVGTRVHEQRLFKKEVTNWRYFEVI